MKNRYEYPFKSQYLKINNKNIHYLDEGQSPVIWMMHCMGTEEGRKIASVLPDSEFYLTKNTGHYIKEDNSEEVARIMIRFLISRNPAIHIE